MAGQRWLSRREVAGVRGVSVDTVKRDERRGVYRRTRPRPGDPAGTVEIAYDDLVAAGHVPEPALEDSGAQRPDADPVGVDEPAELRVRLARAEAERDGLADALGHARAEAVALRELLRAALDAGRQG